MRAEGGEGIKYSENTTQLGGFPDPPFLSPNRQKTEKRYHFQKKLYLCGQEEIVIGAEELKAGFMFIH